MHKSHHRAEPLRPAFRVFFTAASIVCLCLLLACNAKQNEPVRPTRSAAAPANTAADVARSAPAPAEPPLAEAEVKAFVERWLSVQNTGDFAGYEQLYGERMNGHKRAGERSYRFDRAGWLKDRKQMFLRPQTVAAENVRVAVNATGAVVTLTQHFASGAFKDRGEKRLVLLRRRAGLRIAREEMLDSNVLSEGRSSPVHGFYFVVHADKPYAVLQQAVDPSWAVDHSRGSYTRVVNGANEWPVFVTSYDVSSSLPAEQRALIGKTLRVWNERGAECTARIDGLSIVAALTPAYELEMAWAGKDPDLPTAPWPAAKIADDIGGWAAQNGGLSLATPLVGCDGVFALDEGREAKVLGSFEEAPADVRAEASGLTHALKAYGQSQREYERDGPNPEHASWHTGEWVRVLKGQRSPVVVSTFSTDYAMGVAGGMLTLLEQSPAGALVVKSASGRSLPAGLSPHLLIDLDVDGTPELLTRYNDFELRHLVRFSSEPSSVLSVSYADLACKL